MAHMHAWTADKDSPFHVDTTGGEEIRKQVLWRLQTECDSRGWNRRDEDFAHLVVMCSPKTIPRNLREAEDMDRNVLPTGWFVFLGVRDFLRDQANALREDAQKAWRRAEKITGDHSLPSLQLQDRIREMRNSAKQEDDAVGLVALQEAAALVEDCIELTQKATRLSRRTVEEMTVLSAHGFVVDQKRNQAVLAKIIDWKSKEGDLKRCKEYKLPHDIGNFLPIPAAKRETENWSFTRQKELDKQWKYFQSRAEEIFTSRRSGSMEARQVRNADKSRGRASSETQRSDLRRSGGRDKVRRASEGHASALRSPTEYLVRCVDDLPRSGH